MKKLTIVLLLIVTTVVFADKQDDQKNYLKNLASEHNYNYMTTEQQKEIYGDSTDNNPIGTILAWPNAKLLPLGYVPCNAIPLGKELFNAAYIVLGDQYRPFFAEGGYYFYTPEMNVISDIGFPQWKKLNISKGKERPPNSYYYSGTAERPCFIRILSHGNRVNKNYPIGINTNICDKKNKSTNSWGMPDDFGYQITEDGYNDIYSFAYRANVMLPIGKNYRISASVCNVTDSQTKTPGVEVPFVSTATDQDNNGSKPQVIYIIKVTNLK